MAISKYTKESIVREFLGWLPYEVIRRDNEGKLDGWVYEDRLIEEWTATFVECDSAVAFGRGHQSRSHCVRTDAGHTNHIEDTYDIEWADEDCKQEFTRPRDGKVFRLAFNDHGWF